MDLFSILLTLISLVQSNLLHFNCCNGYFAWNSNYLPFINQNTAKQESEDKIIQQLYEDALTENDRKLIIYAGGDEPGQLNDTKIEFEAKFPGIKLEIIVDFSKYHGPRIDAELSSGGSGPISFDIAQLQSVQDFPRWKKEGVLLKYKPVGWDHVYNEFKDPDGYFTGVFVVIFTTALNVQLVPNDSRNWPREAFDYLRPELKNRIIITYPNDDDAVLFWFKQVVDKYGFQYLSKLKSQNPTFIRGTQAALDAVAEGNFTITMSADAGLRAIPGRPRLLLPKYDPFVLWGQTAAIFKRAKHVKAAKLYMSWQLSKSVQKNAYSFSVRNDILPPVGYGYKEPVKYPNGSPIKFYQFMSNREEVERFRAQITLIFGEVLGKNPNGNLGLFLQ